MTEDHPLYFQKGKDREIMERWRGRRLGMLFISLLFAGATSYLSYWYLQHRDKFDLADRLPFSVIYALALLAFSLVGAVVYQALYFRCPRCQHFTGFEIAPNALTGDVFKKESFYCYNCRVRLH